MKAFILEQKQYQIDNQRNTDILNAVIDKSGDCMRNGRCG